MIRRRRGDHSRLGYALLLCYLRYPGRPLQANEQPAARSFQLSPIKSTFFRKPSMTILVPSKIAGAMRWNCETNSGCVPSAHVPPLS